MARWALGDVAAGRDTDPFPDRSADVMSLSNSEEAQVAVLIPCHNEAMSIAKVIGDFRRALPQARILVYDNNSTDETVERARAAGAEVYTEHNQGKGHVVRRMFGDIDADVYVMVDGDDTYDAADAPRLVARLLDESLDMVNGRRVEEGDGSGAYRSGHRLGNTLFNRIVQAMFGAGFDDIFSGYKVLSRRFVKSFPALSREFEIETELTVHALTLRLPVAEVPIRYRERPAGSESKLRTYRDGAHILTTIFVLLKHERPFLLYGVAAAALAALSIAIFIPILIEYLQTGLVPRFPTAILSSALMLAAGISLAIGLIVSAIKRGRWELRRMFYLNAATRIAPAGDPCAARRPA